MAVGATSSPTAVATPTNLQALLQHEGRRRHAVSNCLLCFWCFLQLRTYTQKRLTTTVEEDASNREFYEEVGR
jgi:hypothetical protein